MRHQIEQAGVDAVLADRPHVANEQRHLVGPTARSGDAIALVVGNAG